MTASASDVKNVRGLGRYGSENSQALSEDLAQLKCFIAFVLNGGIPSKFDWNDKSPTASFQAELEMASTQPVHRYMTDVLVWGKSYLDGKEELVAALTEMKKSMADYVKSENIPANVLHWGTSKITMEDIVDRVGKLQCITQKSMAITKVARLKFTALDNGTIGSHPASAELPKGALVTKVWVSVDEAFASATDSATIALSLESAGDLKAAAAFASWPVGLQSMSADGAVANMIKVTEDRNIMLEVAGEDLTAGSIAVYVEYIHAS